MTNTERTSVITVASSGFGAAAVRTFGDRVWGGMRDAEGRNTDKKAEPEGYSPSIAIAEMNITRDASVTDGFVSILAAGRVDVLTSNADLAQKTITHERTKIR